MRRTGWTPSIVPTGNDQNVYIVVDDFGRLGRAYRETDVGKADLETTISDLMSGQYSNRSASSHSIRWSIGPKMSRKISRGKFAVASISPVMPCPRR